MAESQQGGQRPGSGGKVHPLGEGEGEPAGQQGWPVPSGTGQ